MKSDGDISKQLARFLGTFESGDVSTVEAIVSREADVLGIGTDPDEWWPGRDNLMRAVRAQVPEMHGAGMTFRTEDERSYSEGDVGWSAAQASIVMADGSTLPTRFTSVWRREGGDWKLVNFHVSVGMSNEQLLGQELTV